MTRGSMIMIMGVALGGCYESVAPERPDAGTTTDTAASGRISTTRDTDGTYTTLVDATSMTEWVHGDVETGAEIANTGAWDLRFQRFHISVNGGASGSGGVMVAPVTGVSFAEMSAPPTTGWISDAPDGDDANTDPDYAFEQGDGWYEYNPTTHKLTPRAVIWAIQTNGGSTIKLEITRYYDDAGTAGKLELHWAVLAGGH